MDVHSPVLTNMEAPNTNEELFISDASDLFDTSFALVGLEMDQFPERATIGRRRRTDFDAEL